MEPKELAMRIAQVLDNKKATRVKVLRVHDLTVLADYFVIALSLIHICKANTAQRTYAQLSADEKDAISHRARALALMEQELPAFLADTGILGAVCGPACPPKE